MKKIIFLSLLISLFSCGNDDQLSDTIVGEWTLSSVTIGACTDASNNIPLMIADSYGCAVFNGTMLCQNVTFNAGGTAVNNTILDGVTDTQNITYTVNNDNNTVTSLDEDNNSNTFAVTDNTITLINAFGSCTITSQFKKQ